MHSHFCPQLCRVPWGRRKASLLEHGEKPRRHNPASKHVSPTTSATRRAHHEFGNPDTQPRICQGHPDTSIAPGSTYKRTRCRRRHLPTNSHLLSCSLLEHPAAAALPRRGYTRFEPQNSILLAGNQSWVCHRAERELLTEILVKMESRSDRPERYILILSPPNLRWRYSGIVTICQGGKRVIIALSRPPPLGMVPGKARGQLHSQNRA